METHAERRKVKQWHKVSRLWVKNENLKYNKWATMTKNSFLDQDFKEFPEKWNLCIFHDYSLHHHRRGGVTFDVLYKFIQKYYLSSLLLQYCRKALYMWSSKTTVHGPLLGYLLKIINLSIITQFS